jgi:hypothetical protein
MKKTAIPARRDDFLKLRYLKLYIILILTFCKLFFPIFTNREDFKIL